MTASFILSALLVAGCQQSPEPLSGTHFVHEAVPVQDQPAQEAAGVLIVINKSSPESIEIGSYYRAKRNIPKENVLMISVSTTEEIGHQEYSVGIEGPVRDAIQKSKSRVDYIVTTTGVPIRIKEGGYSVDAFLAATNLKVEPITELKPEIIQRCQNPYYRSTEPFSSEKYNMYLVSRLTGYTTADAKALVDNSLAAARKTGPFVFDMADNRKTGGYAQMQSLMERSADSLKSQSMSVVIDKTNEFILPSEPVMGYVSWGSNDSAFNVERYKKIQFLPGAICETFVSTSGRTFRPTTGGQSLIADLIAAGVTGIKGYVSEPYTFALAQPDVLFDRYVAGFNLAESFYSASFVIKWKDVVVGDPLCRPYAKR
ncbi:TIGR03790 family protein [Kamptonema cortianum]|nr:TIGR03790 family protein [Geitlerinema splendidum]MDK3157563.1 TIGR03790 family protein [Kamptonema cortianum]